MAKAASTVDKREELVNQIIEKMEQASKFETPWFKCIDTPFNPMTGTRYRGINYVSLALAGFDDPRFFTFNGMQQFAEKNGLDLHIKKGSKGMPIFHANKVNVVDNKEATLEGEDTKTKQVFYQKCVGVVFNASQIEGMPPFERKRNLDFSPIEEAELVKEAMIEMTGLKLNYHERGEAFYAPSRDTVMLPPPERFKTTEMYYTTMLHEFGHATGHESRVGRDIKGRFGDQKYAFEELVAELSSYFIGSEIGIPYDGRLHENHAAYLKSWIGALKEDKSMLFSAASHAGRAADYQIERKEELKQERLFERGAEEVQSVKRREREMEM